MRERKCTILYTSGRGSVVDIKWDCGVKEQSSRKLSEV